MIAVDTNLLVRFATNDDAKAKDAVDAVFGANEILLLKTVLLETEWVLRSRYAYTRSQIRDFFGYLQSLAGVVFEDEQAVIQAFEFLDQGLDFADALHIASAGDKVFLTMDRPLVKRTAGARHKIVRLLKRQ